MPDQTTTAAAALRPAAAPSAEELLAALRTVMRAWSPTTALPGDPDHTADDGRGPDNLCGCAGEDEDGEPVCDCGDGCSCTSCEASRHELTRRCSHTPAQGARCTAPAQYRVVSYRVWPTQVRDLTPGATCPHAPAGQPCHCSTTGEYVFVEAGAKPDTYQYHSACSLAHARAVADTVRDRDAGHLADGEQRVRWWIETWTHTPHWSRWPEHLVALDSLIDMAAGAVRRAVRASSAPGMHEVGMASLRQALAQAAWCAAQPVPTAEDDGSDDRHHEGPDEPEYWPEPDDQDDGTDGTDQQ